MSALSIDTCHEWFAKAQKKICELFSSGRSFQIVCNAVSGLLRSVISASAFSSWNLSNTASHTWFKSGRSGGQESFVGEVWAVLAEPFRLLNCEIRSWKLYFCQFGVHQVNTVWATHLCKVVCNIWCKNIHAFLRYSDFRVGTFYFVSPCRV